MARLLPVAYVKFFEKEVYAEQFIKGHIYMNRLGYFKTLERRERHDGRPDANEAVVSWHQPDRVKIEITLPGIGTVNIGEKDLAGPISISRDFFLNMHVFCMTCLSIPDPAEMKASRSEIQAALQAALRVDERCLGFGDHAVVVSAIKFIPHIQKSLRDSNFWFKASPVEYYYEQTFHGDFKYEDAVFRKQKAFSYQAEYRICLMTNTVGQDPLTLKIGDMSGFAIKARPSEINAALRVTLGSPA